MGTVEACNTIILEKFYWKEESSGKLVNVTAPCGVETTPKKR